MLSNYAIYVLCLITVLEDKNLVGITQLFYSPHVWAYLTFVLLFVTLKHTLMTVYQVMSPWNYEMIKCYRDIEDRIFMEEYEDADQEFSIKNLSSYIDVVKILDTNSLVSIN